MKFIALVLFALTTTTVHAQNPQPGTDITVTGGNVTITVRGTGGYVCSAQDDMKKLPRLGRGMTQAEAEANAHFLAAQTNGGDDFFVKTISCEASGTGNGGIRIDAGADGVRIVVEGPSQVQCIARNSSANSGAIPYIANAGTQTEAFALASNACAVGSNDDGFFCRTECQSTSAPIQGTGITIPGKSKLKFKLPWKH